MGFYPKHGADFHPTPFRFEVTFHPLGRVYQIIFGGTIHTIILIDLCCLVGGAIDLVHQGFEHLFSVPKWGAKESQNHQNHVVATVEDLGSKALFTLLEKTEAETLGVFFCFGLGGVEKTLFLTWTLMMIPNRNLQPISRGPLSNSGAIFKQIDWINTWGAFFPKKSYQI